LRENRRLGTPFPSNKRGLARKPRTRCVEATMMWNDSTPKWGRVAMGEPREGVSLYFKK
jgi:hypothetical protein